MCECGTFGSDFWQMWVAKIKVTYVVHWTNLEEMFLLVWRDYTQTMAK